MLMLLFNTFVKSKLEYFAFVWQSGYNTHNKSIERIRRKFSAFKADVLLLPIGVSQNYLLEIILLVCLATDFLTPIVAKLAVQTFVFTVN